MGRGAFAPRPIFPLFSTPLEGPLGTVRVCACARAVPSGPSAASSAFRRRSRYQEGNTRSDGSDQAPQRSLRSQVPGLRRLFAALKGNPRCRAVPSASRPAGPPRSGTTSK